MFGPLLKPEQYNELVHILTWKPSGFGGYSYGLREVWEADVAWFWWAVEYVHTIRDKELKKTKR